MPSLLPVPASGSGSVSVLSSSVPPPCSGNFSWCEKVYLMANCRLPRRSCLVRCESAVCCIFSQVINMYTLSLSRSGCRPCVLLGPVRVRGKEESKWGRGVLPVELLSNCPNRPRSHSCLSDAPRLTSPHLPHLGITKCFLNINLHYIYI